jgi:hypothetical protein
MQESANSEWRTVDRALRVIAKRRAQLDVVEARYLREALALEIWKPLGMVSALDYLERVLDYSPHAARERLRVAVALGELPQLGEALARNELSFSAVRELTRITIPETQAEWIAAAKGKNQREVEELVAGRARGSRPSDPADPDLRPRSLHLKLTPDVYARFRQARVALDKEHDRHLDDNEILAALLNTYLEGATGTQPTERARHQICLTVCEVCEQGWQEGGGRRIAVDAATVERAKCDAQHIGSIHADVPARAYQDIPPAVRRLVLARDGGCCQIPGCRSSRNVDCHHLEARAAGGGHDPMNIVATCGACHRAIHDGRLIVSGTATKILVHRPNEPDPTTALDADGSTAREIDALSLELGTTGPAGSVWSASFVGHGPNLDAASHVGRDVLAAEVDDVPEQRSKVDLAIVRSQARDALVGAGWKPPIAGSAVNAALAKSPDASLEQVLVTALRFCLSLTRGSE